MSDDDNIVNVNGVKNKTIIGLKSITTVLKCVPKEC